MGLDNGIVIKLNDLTKKININSHFSITMDNNYAEICYWRKCRGLRDQIVNYLMDKYDMAFGAEEYILDTQDIQTIITFIKSWNKKTWTAEGYSIWDWKEIKHCLRENANNLMYILAKKEDYPELQIEFYDSY